MRRKFSFGNANVFWPTSLRRADGWMDCPDLLIELLANFARKYGLVFGVSDIESAETVLVISLRPC